MGDGEADKKPIKAANPHLPLSHGRMMRHGVFSSPLQLVRLLGNRARESGLGTRWIERRKEVGSGDGGREELGLDLPTRAGRIRSRTGETGREGRRGTSKLYS